LDPKTKSHYTNLQFNGDSIKAQHAPEPSDIIWENLYMTSGQIRKNEFISCLIITFFLILTLALFTYLKSFGAMYD
jgi:hypothetical protein